jgi:6-phosphogluconolactonase (cycloisomerase 2 family)
MCSSTSNSPARCAGAIALGACVAIAMMTATARAEPISPAVYVVNNVSDEVTSFRLTGVGELERVGNYATSDGPLAAALTPNGYYLAVTHGTQNEVEEVLQVFRTEDDASLTLVLTTLVPNAPLDTVWLNDEFLAVTETTFGGANNVHTYRFDPDVPSLTAVDAEYTGGFNTYLALHPNGLWLYAQDSYYNDIRWFDVEADGSLTLGGTISTGSLYPLKLAVTHYGQYLYSAGGISGGGHAIQAFRILPDGGLAAVGGSPFESPGQSPAYLAVSRTDSYLFVGHGTDATVWSFAIDAGGGLTSTGEMFDVGMQGTVGDLDTVYDYLLITDESTAIDGVAGLYCFSVNRDGSFDQLGEINETDGVRPESIVVWHGYPPPGDANRDGAVDIADLVFVINEWGMPDSLADVTGDGQVEIDDLVMVILNWG